MDDTDHDVPAHVGVAPHAEGAVTPLDADHPKNAHVMAAGRDNIANGPPPHDNNTHELADQNRNICPPSGRARLNRPVPDRSSKLRSAVAAQADKPIHS